jgi:hypothetical protein
LPVASSPPPSDTLKSVVRERRSMSEDPAAEPESVVDDVWARETAPQSPYTMRQVGIGLAVLVVGAVVAYGVPLALV